jgi:predicted membrane protein
MDFLLGFLGLIMSLNLFFIILLYFLNLYTSDERFQYERLGFAIYSSLGLVITWALAWPVLAAARKVLSVKSV